MRASRLFAIFMFSCLLLLSVRLAMLQQLSADILGCRICVLPNLMAADLPYLAALLALFGLSFLLAALVWRLLWRGAALLGLWIYALDLAVMAQFGTRLSLDDALVYVADVNLAFGVLRQLPGWQRLGGAGALLMTAWLWWQPVKAGSRRRIGMALLGSLALGGLPALLLAPADYVHGWALRNVVAVNLPSGVATGYSEETVERLAREQPATQCHAGRRQRDSIVVVVLESWSTYHSKRWLGTNDWTPRLDALAGQGHWFERLHAGGFNTNEGLVSLFTGRDILLPVLPVREMGAFEGAWQPKVSLPALLAADGYHTAYLTSGNLGFTRKGEWLERIGFAETRGHDNEAFDGLRRWHFESVADEALYGDALNHLGRLREASAPFFAVVQSVTSHHPFVHPETGARSEKAVFRYMDQTAADFIEALLADGFLDEGMIIVVSDHRAMTFVTEAEQRRFGRSAASRIPGFVLARDLQGRHVTEPFHQADLVPSVLRHVSERVCPADGVRDWLKPADSEPRCLLHARGDWRNRIDVFCPEGEGTVRVEGDDSHFLEHEGLSEARRGEMLERIARERLGFLPRHDPVN